jgi:glycosyltransferase involved in cell wall biosynthesis
VSPIAEPHLGGSQAILADLALGLAGRGHDLTVFAADGSAIPGVDVVEVGVDPADLAATLFREGRPAPAVRAAETAFRHVAALVAAERFHLVHNHAFDVPAVRAFAGGDVPVVHTVHLPPSPEMAEVLRARLDGRERAGTVVTVSRAQSRAWSSAGVPNVLVPNGVPVPLIPWSTGPGTGALFAGRFSPEKGAVDAIRIARRAGLSIDVAGWAYDREYTERELGPLMAGPEVHALGSLARRDLWRRMSRAAVVLCPSRWDEPFGLVAAEAQAAGTPVVGYRRGALAEVIAEGETGFLVADGDVDAAARAVGQALHLDRTTCRRRAERVLDVEATVGRLEDLYASVAGSAEIRRG